MQDGLKTAAAVPLGTMRLADSCWGALAEMALHGNLASRSDLEVGAKSLEAGIWGAYRNVAINLGQIEDAAFREATLEEAQAMARRAAEGLAGVLAALEGRTDQ
jgi:glutamate formiminotransferase/formiminotetrahydrofolate cyclodeaminase